MTWFGLVLWHISHYGLFNAKSCLYLYIKYIWLGLVLWRINHCRLFNAKSSLYIYIKYIWFGLVWFYGISAIVGYLMPNPVYTYVAERISYFCLARNLIRPLGSTHNFTQSGWFILFNLDHHSEQHKLGAPPNTLSFTELLRSGQT